MKKFLASFLLIAMSVFCFGQKVKFVPMKCVITKPEKESVEKVAKYEMEFFSAIFTIKKAPTIRILLYGDPEKYKKAELAIPRYARGTDGFFSPTSKQIAVKKNERFVQTCYHEMSHLFFHCYMKNIPTWVNEGLACYFEQATFDSTGKIEIKTWKSAKSRVTQLIRKKKFDARWIIKASYKKFHKRHDLDHYEESWAIVYFLMQTHRDVFVEIIKNLGAKKTSEEAIESCYEGGMKKLQTDLENYYK